MQLIPFNDAWLSFGLVDRRTWWVNPDQLVSLAYDQAVGVLRVRLRGGDELCMQLTAEQAQAVIDGLRD